MLTSQWATVPVFASLLSQHLVHNSILLTSIPFESLPVFTFQTVTSIYLLAVLFVTLLYAFIICLPTPRPIPSILPPLRLLPLYPWPPIPPSLHLSLDPRRLRQVVQSLRSPPCLLHLAALMLRQWYKQYTFQLVFYGGISFELPQEVW